MGIVGRMGALLMHLAWCGLELTLQNGELAPFCEAGLAVGGRLRDWKGTIEIWGGKGGCSMVGMWRGV